MPVTGHFVYCSKMFPVLETKVLSLTSVKLSFGCDLSEKVSLKFSKMSQKLGAILLKIFRTKNSYTTAMNTLIKYIMDACMAKH